MRGRIRAPLVLEMMEAGWWKSGTQVVLLAEVGWGVRGVQSACGCPLVGQLKPIEVVDVGAVTGDRARGRMDGAVGVYEMGGIGADCHRLRREGGVYTDCRVRNNAAGWCGKVGGG